MDGRASNVLLHREFGIVHQLQSSVQNASSPLSSKHTMLNEVHEENPSTAQSEMRRQTFSIAEGKMARSGAPGIDTDFEGLRRPQMHQAGRKGGTMHF